MRTLLRHALRLRPDRIIVGEVRGPEALDMIQALSTGHAGSMSTIHANGPSGALDRLAMLAAMAPERVPGDALARQIAAAVDVVVFVVRDGAARTQPVKVARTSGGESVIVEGLRGGETVVTDGQLLLADGTRVQPKQARAGT